MEIEHILQIIEAVKASSLASFEYKEGNVKLAMKTDKYTGEVKVIHEPYPLFTGIMGESRPVAAGAEGISAGGVQIDAQQAAAAIPAGVPNTFTGAEKNSYSDGNKEAGSSDHIIKSPLVGTFYCASAEGEQPFVSVGSKVKKGQVLGIIEAMKLMNEIESDFDGIVEEIMIDNEQVVEYGQPLFRIR